jgi:hypothetical protein
LFAESKNELQQMVNIFYTIATEISILKTKIMVVQTKCSAVLLPSSPSIMIEGEELEVVRWCWLSGWIENLCGLRSIVSRVFYSTDT